LAAELAYRGQFTEAYERWGERGGRLYAELAMSGVVPDDSARAQFTEWIEAGSADAGYALPWLAANGHVELLSEFEQQVRRQQSVRNPSTGATRAYTIAIARAYVHLARRDSLAALQAFLSVPDTLCLGCALDRLVEGELLLAMGRPRDAMSVLDERLPLLITPTDVFFRLALARSFRAAGEEARYGEICVQVSTIWQNADEAQRRVLRDACPPS
jgi:hypothetical protein